MPALLKVTFCIYDKPDNVGGPVTWIQGLMRALRARGVDVRCLCLLHWGDTGPALSALRNAGIDCQAVLAPETTEERVRWILDRLRENPPDVFVPNLVVAAYHAARWAREAGIPTVGILHSDDDFYRGMQEEFVFGAEPFRVSGLVCVSREIERDVMGRHPEGVLVRRIAYGVPTPESRVERAPARLRLAFAGRLAEEQKRISDVTRALCKAVAEVSGCDAVIYGDGPDRAAVERILATDGAGLDIRYGGPVPSGQVQARLQECDVFVLLSDYEGLPIALMEAMACGCVPVCLRVRSGIPELIEHGVNGLLVDDRGADFVEAVRSLRDDAGLWRRLSERARSTVEQGFSEAPSADGWAALLRELAGPSGSRRSIPDPRRLRLPPVNPRLASADVRASIPSLPRRLYRRGRMLGGRLKRAVLGLLHLEQRNRPVLRNAVIMRVTGGLANQMLCYKAARYVADLKGASIILDATWYECSGRSTRNFQLDRYDIRCDSIVLSEREMARLTAGGEVVEITRDMLPEPSAPEAARAIDFILSQGVIRCDFWLSMFLRRDADLHAARNGVLDELTLRPAGVFTGKDTACLDLIRKAANPVAVHVRRGDFGTHDGNLLLTDDYYNRSIAKIENRLANPVFFVFSDDIGWCRSNLVSRSEIVFVDFNDERHAFKDMYLASQCRHFILSNESTFSHQVVQLSPLHEGRIVITSGWNDLVRSAGASAAPGG